MIFRFFSDHKNKLNLSLFLKIYKFLKNNKIFINKIHIMGIHESHAIKNETGFEMRFIREIDHPVYRKV